TLPGPAGGRDFGFLEALTRVLSGQAGYNTTVVVFAAAMLGIAAGVIGSFAMLRRQALVSDAMAHATLPGVVGAFLIATSLGASGRSLPLLLLGAAATAAVGAVCIKAILRATRLGEDVAIGAVLSVFFGVGVVLLSVAQGGERGSAAGLNHFIYGQTAALQQHDAILIAALAALALAGAAL